MKVVATELHPRSRTKVTVRPLRIKWFRFIPLTLGAWPSLNLGGGDLYVLNLPPFIGLQSENYDPDTYEIPTTSHGMSQPPADKFSPFSVASTTAFWRHGPQDSSKLLSNTRIVRWSDGSLTLQIASQPRDHYRISTTALRQDYGKNKRTGEVHEYNPDKDSQHYLSAPHAKAEVLRLIHPFSAAMKILPSGEQTDEAVLALQRSLAAAEAVHDPFAAIRNVREDPELAKKRAELAEKDKLRAERKREAQIERESGRKDKVLGRRGLGRGGVGLTVSGLEDEDGMPTARARKPARKGGNRRGDIYSDDEDEGYPRWRTREDEYDQDDGFLAASDEEPEIFDDDEEDAAEEDPDVGDLEIEGKDTVVKSKSRSDRQETPQRSTWRIWRWRGVRPQGSSGGSLTTTMKMSRAIWRREDELTEQLVQQPAEHPAIRFRFGPHQGRWVTISPGTMSSLEDSTCSSAH